jgi:hypothetical protein
MSLFDRAYWVLGKGADTKAFLKKLETRVNDLHKFCPEFAGDILKLQAVIETMGRLNSLDELDGFKASVTQIRKGSEGKSSEDEYSKDQNTMLHDLADLKMIAKTNVDHGLTEGQKKEIVCFDPKEFWWRDPDDEKRALARWFPKNEIVLIEFKPYLDDNDIKSEEIEDNILKLGRLLSRPVAPDQFRTMHCFGLFRHSDCLAFVYELPKHLITTTEPLTETEWHLRKPHLLSTSLKRVDPLPLGMRFDMARDLLKSVILLHASGWLHKNIRPDSVIFFPGNRQPPVRTWIDFTKVHLMGYGYSRPYAAGAPGYGIYGDVDDIQTRKSIKLDMYQHPDKRADSATRYLHANDLYSLGLVFLEIGLWQPLQNLVKDKGDTRDAILQEPLYRLKGHCGNIYADVVKKCLMMSRAVSDEETEEQSDQVLRMYLELGRCCA